MCIILFAINKHPEYKFILAANRDEFYERPTRNAEFWEDCPNILAGRDLVFGGAWLGISKEGRFAAVTNYRNPNQPICHRSRGDLVKDFLLGDDPPRKYLKSLKAEKSEFTGYNLIFGDLRGDIKITYYSNIGKTIEKLDSGIYGLSNHLLDTEWPKITKGKKKFEKALGNISAEKLFKILHNQKEAKERDLPDTGVGIEREKILSPIFIKTPIYGTRSSSLILIKKDGSASFHERIFNGDPDNFSENSFEFKIS